LSSSCARTDDNLHPATPQSTPELPTATATDIGVPSETSTPLPTPVPTDAINPENIHRVKLLHQYWLLVANAAGVDPYEMDISAVTTSPDGNLLAVGGCSKHLVSDLRSGNVYCNGDEADIVHGTPFLVILDADRETSVGVIPENEPSTTVSALAFTQDGEKLIYAIQPGKIAVWDIASQQMETVLLEGEMSMPRIVVSPDGRWIALKTAEQTQVWSTEAEDFVAELPGSFRPQFSADSGRILVYSAEEFIVYETGTWMELLRFVNPCDCVYAFSPDLSLLASSERALSESAPVLVWDTATGEQIQTLTGGRGSTTFLAFSPDGKMLWRAGDHGDLSAWETETWQLLAENIGTFLPIINLHGFQFVEDGRHYLLVSDQHLGLYGLP
jgi:WD40 repeat protein